MKEARYLPKDAFRSFIENLTRDFQVYVPCKEGETVTFQPFNAGKEICLDRPATAAPKDVIFPQSETLFSFEFRKESDAPKKTDVELKADLQFPDTIIFGARPCDARGFTFLDPVYLKTDPYYRGRREKTTIVTIRCPGPFPACFCTSVDGGPDDSTGADVQMTELETGYLLEALTEKGSKVIEQGNLQDGAPFKEEAQRIAVEANKRVKKAFSGGKSVNISKERFHDDSFWEEVTAKCLSCGVCTYTCPTCYCFNITDEQSVNSGVRIRSWDSCMFPHFTLETSGHNPRGKKSQRLKQRIGHKFVYYPETYGQLACSGCGRCIRLCPVSMEISAIVASLADEAADKRDQGDTERNKESRHA
jgi:ferredoxin